MTRLQTCLLAAALLLPADCCKVARAPAGGTPWAEAEAGMHGAKLGDEKHETKG